MDSEDNVSSTGRSSDPMQEVFAAISRKIVNPIRKRPNPSPLQQSVGSSDPSGNNNNNVTSNGINGNNEDEVTTGGGGVGNWRRSCKSLRERCFHMWENAGKFGWLHDVTFEVGSVEKVRVSAHRLILASSCQFFEDLFRTNTNGSREKPLKFPDLDPVGFRRALNYIYTDKIDIPPESDPREIFAILDAARDFKIGELVSKCYAFLRGRITCDNAVDMFLLAQAKNDQRLEELTRGHIANHIVDVFSSPRFLQLSETALCTLLNMDDWYLEEIQVFENVKRWAISKDFTLKTNIQNGEVCGEQLRTAMGRAFFAIRFPLMDKNEFFQQVLAKTNGGIFSVEEVQAFAEYFYSFERTLSRNCLQLFASRPRLEKDEAEPSPSPITTTSEVEVGETKIECHVSIHEDDQENDEEFMDEDEEAVSSSAPVVESVKEEEEIIQPPPKKVRKSTAATLNDYVEVLATGVGKENIEVINETLILTPTLPSARVHLPNLSEFRLRLDSRREFSHGSAFKRYVKEKAEDLDRLLFFDKVGGSNFSNDLPANNLEILLSQKVDIYLQFGESLVFSLNHKTGSLHLNLLKDAQNVIDILHDFPLRMLAISECELTSLEPLRRDLLETIVIRRVKGLKNHAGFLRGCSSLTEVVWNDLGSEHLKLGEDILYNNQHLKKLALAKGKLLVYPKSPQAPVWHSHLTELYMDLCSVPKTAVNMIPSLFPYLKRVKIYGMSIDSFFLYNVLKIESLEWIFVWEMELTKDRSQQPKKSKKKQSFLTEEATIVNSFLIKVFQSDPKLKSDWPTFILEKKAVQSEEQPGTSASALNQVPFDPFDHSKWKGERLKGENKYSFASKLDFVHFSYNQFYPNYDAFFWADSTEKDAKRMEKQKEADRVKVVLGEAMQP